MLYNHLFMSQQIMQESQKENVPIAQFKIVKLHRNSTQYRLGSFVFQPHLQQDDIKSLVSQNSLKLTNVSPCYRYGKSQMVTIRVWLKFCSQWDHGILQLGSQNFGSFFPDFKNISMKNLLVLNLQNNNINSIEMIHWLDAPNLDCIYLHGNPIMTIKSLRKAYFPKLTRLYINISDSQYLSQFSNSNLHLIQNAPRTRQQFKWNKHNSIRWVAKIQSQKLKRVLTGILQYVQNLDSKAILVLNKKNRELQIK